ncbi:hypothetical protein CRE_22164 [Caenorhabditis remanei]|uniref:F-box domain-containing protein n=1 Tax=Caenorhabditis remanei TaxID=31234 RepID=E3NKG1_CAERE|nr:hypothetical protein CRE_22164 [Caenorhabditis remanei]
MTSSTAPSSKELPRESMKLIFKHMNVNSRIRLAHKIPSLRPIEAATLLNVDQLTFKTNQIIINNTIFKVDNYEPACCFDKTNLRIEGSPYLKMSMKSGRHSKVERIVNNREFIDTMLYLAKKLFEGRVMPIQVKYLSISKKDSTAFLPDDLRLAVRDIKIDHNVVKTLESIQPYLHESSIPFDTVFISGTRMRQEDEDYKHPWIQTANFVQILDKSKYATWLHTILDMDICQAHLECQAFQRMEVCIVIDEWIEHGREDGTWFSLGVRTVDDIKHLLVGLSARQGAVVEQSEMLG